MKKRRKEYPVGVVYTLATGCTFATFGEIHEAAEWVLGAPIWTHHFALPGVWGALKNAVSRQFPELLTLEIGESPETRDLETLRVWAEAQVAKMEALMGRKTLWLAPAPKGAWEAMSPVDGIPEGKPVIVLEVDPEGGP